jgi:hypothetical protein
MQSMQVPSSWSEPDNNIFGEIHSHVPIRTAWANSVCVEMEC